MSIPQLLKHLGEVEETGGKIPDWDGKKRKSTEMAWCSDEEDEPANQITRPKLPIQSSIHHTCPSCGHRIELQDQGLHDLPGLPAGVKFDPTDQEILQHLEAKVGSDNSKLHPLIDEFIPTIEGENGICCTHPEKLPGVSKDGQIRHFFHRPSKAYTKGTRKRRKVQSEEEGSETRWHKTGKTRPVFAEATTKGFKKILVLYTNYGRQKKPEKTNWVMHQYHLGNNEEEKDGEIVVSKIFFQTQPRQCGSNNVKDSFDSTMKKRSGGYESSNSPKNTALIEYYNNPSFISYDHENHNNRENPPLLIPNLCVQADGSSISRAAMDANKGKLGRVMEQQCKARKC